MESLLSAMRTISAAQRDSDMKTKNSKNKQRKRKQSRRKRGFPFRNKPNKKI